MDVVTAADRTAMGGAAAADAAAVLRQALADRGTARAVFAAAPSQTETLAALVAAPGIDWRRVTAFHLDEYIGLPEVAPQRFARWLDDHLFGRVTLGTVHRMRPEPDPGAEATRYAALLAEAPLDLICLGVGVNGHLAFNDPPVADFHDPLDVKVVELDETCRRQQVDDGCFAAFGDVPRQALTLTVPRLLRAGRLVCSVPGPAKRAAVRAMLEGPLSTACPASILRTQTHCTLYLDPEADPDG
jgi:glucosamine-6-phosphate deaminase